MLPDIAIAIKDSTMNTVTKAFIDSWIKDKGIPERILTDGGPEFQGLFQELCKMMRVTKHTITPYHPQTNGVTEAKNKIFAAVLAKHCADRQRYWDLYVSVAVLEYNSTVHSDTGYSPYFLCYGVEPLNVIDKVATSIKIDNGSTDWNYDLIRNIEDGLR